jgi:VanZ family protein
MCIAIFIESSFPSDAYPDFEFEFTDKLIHFGIYFILFLAFNYSFDNQVKFSIINKYSLTASLICTTFYGATDEIHQYFVIGRSSDFYDWVADLLGGLFAFFVLILFKKFYKDKKNNSINTAYDTNK